MPSVMPLICIVPRRHNLLILVIPMLCMYSIDASCSATSTTPSKHSVWLSWLAWLTGARFVNIILRWRTGWMNICLLTLTNKIWLFFLPPSEGAIRKTRERQIGQCNRRCSLYCIPSYAIRSSPTTCRGQRTSSSRWLHHHMLIIFLITIFPVHLIPPKPTALGGVSPSVSSEVGM